MNSQLSIKSVLIAGLVATSAMTIFTFMAPLMGFDMNIPKMLAAAMGAPILFGWITHLMIGEILAVNYALIFLKNTSMNPEWKSGLLFGFIPWLVSQIMIMPMMSVMTDGEFISGFFSGSIMIAMASLAGHAVYGAVLGALYKPQYANVNPVIESR
ncbi:MAG: hypothetical protein K9J16_17345 [Melioribacteraceae bacterium]|nr:hypothetical protein [Melioribacteraceae bacterium]MCF8356583.1 hypothetical protein [Melioribacteraceae bacterium]MCF8395978.1 hypothetical protein [Melioribacteraceae bacterium]MCF8421029.1 hypothetical protein [Melioribacteraceae bacterium]